MKILVADDHPLVLEGIISYLVSNNYVVVHSCGTGLEALDAIIGLSPDVAILDHNMPGISGIAIAEQMAKISSPTKIVLLTMHKEQVLLDKAVSVGIRGYLLKDFALDEIGQCLERVSNGESYYSKQLTSHMTIGESVNSEIDKLTTAERKILQFIATGKTSQEVADLLFISVKTVEKHRSAIIRKLQLPHGPNSLAIWAAKNIE